MLEFANCEESFRLLFAVWGVEYVWMDGWVECGGMLGWKIWDIGVW